MLMWIIELYMSDYVYMLIHCQLMDWLYIALCPSEMNFTRMDTTPLLMKAFTRYKVTGRMTFGRYRMDF